VTNIHFASAAPHAKRNKLMDILFHCPRRHATSKASRRNITRHERGHSPCSNTDRGGAESLMETDSSVCRWRRRTRLHPTDYCAPSSPTYDQPLKPGSVGPHRRPTGGVGRRKPRNAKPIVIVDRRPPPLMRAPCL